MPRAASTALAGCMDALKFLYEERGIQMNGHETFDTDASFLAAEADDLACERYVLDNGHLQVEVMANLDKVPATGAVVFVTWPHIAGATASPPVSSRSSSDNLSPGLKFSLVII